MAQDIVVALMGVMAAGGGCGWLGGMSIMAEKMRLLLKRNRKRRKKYKGIKEDRGLVAGKDRI